MNRLQQASQCHRVVCINARRWFCCCRRRFRLFFPLLFGLFLSINHTEQQTELLKRCYVEVISKFRPVFLLAESVDGARKHSVGAEFADLYEDTYVLFARVNAIGHQPAHDVRD